jgi:hypothetical protein
MRDTRAMRLRAVVLLAAMPLLLGAWTLSSGNHMPWNPRGTAVVKTPGGVSHVIRSSVCNFGPHAGRLRFGGDPINSDSTYMSLVVRELKGNPTVLNIEDGLLRLGDNSSFFTVLGTAHVQVRPARRGTFVLLIHKGGGATGKVRYTGSWNCG